MESQAAKYTFIPSMRRGLTTFVKSISEHRGTSKVKIRLNAWKKDSSTERDTIEAEKKIRLYGPGDIIGFDSSIVVRTDPKNDVGDFEPNYFPLVEFADPDFPWRYSLADKEGNAAIPWITLIVLVAENRGNAVKEFEDISTAMQTTRKEEAGKSICRKIRVSKAFLPDLTQAKRWAHVQFLSEKVDEITANLSYEQFANLFNKTPEYIVSRLLCARRLRPGTSYNAFVVPTYELGRRAALGLPIEDIEDPRTPAWPQAEDVLELPYYYKWEYRTGLRGDFEHLVRLLEPRVLSSLGKREFDCTKPGFGVRGVSVDQNGDNIEMEGALQATDTSYSFWGHDRLTRGKPEPFQEDIAQKVLNCNTAFMQGYYLLAGPGKYADLDKLTIKPAGSDEEVALELVCPSERKITIECQLLPYENQDGDQQISQSNSYQKEHVFHFNVRLNRTYKFKILLKDTYGSMTQIEDFKIDVPIMPYVTPPMYGCWHKATHRVDPTKDDWFNTINCDPRHRIAAGLGAQYVKKEQEALMASAWDQLGEVLKANAVLRKAQMARATSWSTGKKLSTIKKYDENLYLKITGAMHRHLACSLQNTESPETRKLKSIHHHLHTSSNVPIQAVSSCYRRLSTRGSIQKKKNLVKAKSFESLMKNPESLLSRNLSIAGTLNFSDIGKNASSTLAAIRSTASTASVLMSFGAPTPGNTDPGISINPGTHSGPGGLNESFSGTETNVVRDILESASIDKFAFESYSAYKLTELLSKTGWTSQLGNAAQLKEKLRNITTEDFTAALKWLNPTVANKEKTVPENILQILADKVEKLIDPRTTIREKVFSRIYLPINLRKYRDAVRIDDFAPIMASPHFDQPIYLHLLELSQDYLLPGLEKIPQNTLGLLETNGRFIESFLVGCNHEFAAELLWRRYPTDQRGTYFRQFWDRKIQLPSDEDGEDLESQLESIKDIKDIHTWGNSQLGNNDAQRTNPDKESVVLVIRGDLLKKYPNTIIYALDTDFDPSNPDSNLSKASIEWEKMEFPQFTGSIPPDISFVGFSFNEEAARNKLFVLAQIALENRFGGDITFSGEPGDICWEKDFGVGSLEEDYGKYVTNFGENSGLNDNSSSAIIAAKTFQKPVRIAVHGSKLLPKKKE